MPAGSIALRMPGEPIMTPMTIHVSKRQLLRRKLTSSPNMPEILHRSQSPSSIRAYGMYQIPPLSFLHTSNLSGWSLSRKEIDSSAFIEELGKLIIHHCCAWQLNSINYASIQDLTSWSRQRPLLISSDGLLVTRIDKQFEDLSLYEQGGATYQDCTWWKLTISNIVVTTLQGFLLPQMSLLRSRTRTFVLPRSRSLPSMTGQSIWPP